jgi:hypothetical protein
MSDDLLLLSVEQNAQALVPLRSNPPLYAAVASCEDAGTNPRCGLERGLAEYVRVSSGPVGAIRECPFRTGTHGHTYGLTVFAGRGVSAAQRAAAFRAFLPVANRLSRMVRELHETTLDRLGFRPASGPLPDDWVWVFFHLAWHFPHHFARGVVHRARLLRRKGGPFVAPEDELQLGGVTGVPKDCYPGLIFSRFPRELDLVTATGFATELLRRAIRAGGAFQVTDQIRDQLFRHQVTFGTIGAFVAAQRPAPLDPDVEVRVLRLDSSFRTPPRRIGLGIGRAGPFRRTSFWPARGP